MTIRRWCVCGMLIFGAENQVALGQSLLQPTTGDFSSPSVEEVETKTVFESQDVVGNAGDPLLPSLQADVPNEFFQDSFSEASVFESEEELAEVSEEDADRLASIYELFESYFELGLSYPTLEEVEELKAIARRQVVSSEIES